MYIFNLKLKNLQAISRSAISELTHLAQERVDCAPSIIESIDSMMLEADQTIRLPLLCLIDSIFKNLAGPYQDYYKEHIGTYFCQVLDRATPDQIDFLKALKDSWEGLLPGLNLKELDSWILFQRLKHEEEALVQDIQRIGTKLQNIGKQRKKRKAEETESHLQEQCYKKPRKTDVA